MLLIKQLFIMIHLSKILNVIAFIVIFLPIENSAVNPRFLLKNQEIDYQWQETHSLFKLADYTKPYEPAKQNKYPINLDFDQDLREGFRLFALGIGINLAITSGVTFLFKMHPSQKPLAPKFPKGQDLRLLKLL